MHIQLQIVSKFLLFVNFRGSNCAEGGTYQLADMYHRGFNLLADMKSAVKTETVKEHVLHYPMPQGGSETFCNEINQYIQCIIDNFNSTYCHTGCASRQHSLAIVTSSYILITAFIDTKNEISLV